MRARLDASVVLEPLVRSWYATPFLVAPATSALVMVGSHEPVMESFVAMPESHVSAAADPALAGGPFMAVPAERVGEVEALLDRTRRENGPLRALACALMDLARRLDGCRGEPLDDLYATLPEVLAGRVELVYDLSHRATYRLIEPLLHRSTDLGLERSQSLLLRRSGGRRAFALSTPRLPTDEELAVDVPFASEAAAHLVRARWAAVEVGALADDLGVPVDALGPFMTDAPLPVPCAPPAVEPGELHVRYLGHASLLVQTATTSVLLDPSTIFDQADAGGWAARTGYDLPSEIDAIVLTHTPFDHVSIEALLQLRPRVGRVLVPRSGIGDLQDPSLRLVLESLGFPDVVEVSELDRVVVGDLEVTALPFLGEHADLRVGTKAAFSISGADRTIAAVVDSRNLDGRLYDRLREVVGPVDAVFLGMECVGAPLTWAYGSFLHGPIDRADNMARRLAASDADQALDLVQRLGAPQAYVYAMGMEPWMWHLTTVSETADSPQRQEADRFVLRARELGLTAARLRGTADLRF